MQFKIVKSWRNFLDREFNNYQNNRRNGWWVFENDLVYGMLIHYVDGVYSDPAPGIPAVQRGDGSFNFYNNGVEISQDESELMFFR
jgi:hypothetical protein